MYLVCRLLSSSPAFPTRRSSDLLVPGAHVFVASNPLVSFAVARALVDIGLERRGEIIRLVMTLRGGDRPKNAHQEFPDVSVMPRSIDRKSTRLNSSHRCISYAVFCRPLPLSLHDALPICSCPARMFSWHPIPWFRLPSPGPWWTSGWNVAARSSAW